MKRLKFIFENNKKFHVTELESFNILNSIIDRNDFTASPDFYG